jgi:hypothetical protein
MHVSQNGARTDSLGKKPLPAAARRGCAVDLTVQSELAMQTEAWSFHAEESYALRAFSAPHSQRFL